MRSAVGVGRTDATLDGITTGGILDPSALVKALPSAFHLFTHQRSAGLQILEKKLTTFVVQLPEIVYSLLHPSFGRNPAGVQQIFKNQKQCLRHLPGKEQIVCWLSEVNNSTGELRVQYLSGRMR